MVAALAHSAPDGRVHLLDEHLREVARRAREHASAFDGAEHAYLAGLWHDLGKYAADFQAMIRASNGTDAHIESERSVPARPRVDHSTAGAAHAGLVSRTDSIAIAFAIAGHHAGLSDWSSLRARLAERGPARLHSAMLGEPDADLVQQVMAPLPTRVTPRSADDRDRFRSLELFTRMIFSALCDADFLDTEAFFDPGRAALRGGHRSISELAARLGDHLDGLSRNDTIVNRARAEIRTECLAAATRPRGILTLTVPTGGGKTLAAMELALRHALHHDLRRVVVAIPFTSILEQNAAVYRQAFALAEHDATVLEHHSSLDPERETPRSRLASENWAAPIVVTTNVQLLESLFARRTSKCRKLHNLARSVIILDEAQTLPRGMLAPTTEVLDALVRDYGCSVILCTATQPAITREVLGDCGFTHSSEVIGEPHELAERLRRVDVDWSRARATTPWPELAEQLAREADVLAIVHRRDDARELCALVDQLHGDASAIHLSALMCPAHRSAVLGEVRARKIRGEPVRLVSTQLVEAGVDLDFPVVYRALSGIDSLTQAAGRCNREGRLSGRGSLRVFLAPTRPPKGILEQGLEVTRSMLRDDLDLFAPSTHARYFEDLYRLHVHDEKEVQRLRAELAFEQVSAAYTLIDDDWSAPVVIPWDDRARRAISTLDRLGPSRARLRELTRVTVNVAKRQLDAWSASGAVRSIADDTARVLVSMAAYDKRFGLIPDNVGALSAEESVL